MTEETTIEVSTQAPPAEAVVSSPTISEDTPSTTTATPADSLDAAVSDVKDAAIEGRKPVENELHHILHVALTELGKLGHFTFEEVKTLAEKVAAKI